MAELDHDFLRKLAEWDTKGAPVSTVYMNVDGKRFPRKQDLELRADDLCRQLRDKAAGLDRDAKKSVEDDCARIKQYLADLERGATRGVALFASSRAGLWEAVALPRPVTDHAAVGDSPYLLPLEAVVETYESFCTVIVDRSKARVFLARMGEIEEQSDVFDDVPGQHKQGGWSQARYERHIDEHAEQHLKHVADVLLRFFKRRKFDHLIIAGPDELLPHFEGVLHDYLKQRVAMKTPLSMVATSDEVLEKSLAAEEAIEIERERQTVERLRAESAAGRQAVVGLRGVLEALNDGRVDTLVVPFGFESKGARCTECGRLWANGSKCRICGGSLEHVADVVENAVAAAVRQSSRVETITFPEALPEPLEDVGALLRY